MYREHIRLATHDCMFMGHLSHHFFLYQRILYSYRFLHRACVLLPITSILLRSSRPTRKTQSFGTNGTPSGPWSKENTATTFSRSVSLGIIHPTRSCGWSAYSRSLLGGSKPTNSISSDSTWYRFTDTSFYPSFTTWRKWGGSNDQRAI